MSRERDERWAYAALALLALAYIAYRIVGSSGGRAVTFDLPFDLRRIKLGELGRSLPYVVAPLIAVISELFRRRRARALREDWDARVKSEGFVRDEENVEVRVVRGGRGAFAADLRLTRVALYLFDRTGRRDPVRLAVSSMAGSEKTVTDVQLMEGTSTGRPRVRVTASSLTFEFPSVAAEGWWSDLRSAIGKPTSRTAGESEPETRGEY